MAGATPRAGASLQLIKPELVRKPTDKEVNINLRRTVSPQIQQMSLLQDSIENFDLSLKPNKPRWKARCETFLESYPFVIFIAVVTVYSLFFDDSREVACSLDYDDIFFSFTCASFGIFTIEIIFGSICREEYFLTFFFWLDIIATASMITDVGWVWEVVLGVGTSTKAGNAA